MKNYKSTVPFAALFIAVLISTSSCMNKKTEDTKDVAEEHNEAKFNDSKNENDAKFLVNAAEINMEEISLGKLAQQKGSTQHVKELGEMMESEHSKSLADLRVLADSKSISLPTSPTDDGKNAYKKLNNESSKDFGKAYADMMVSGHKDAIALFEKAATDCTDADIKAWAAATLPALRMHLDHSITCQKQCEKM